MNNVAAFVVIALVLFGVYWFFIRTPEVAVVEVPATPAVETVAPAAPQDIPAAETAPAVPAPVPTP